MDPRNTPSPAEKLLDEILLASEQATPLKSARKCMLEVLEKALAEKPAQQQEILVWLVSNSDGDDDFVNNLSALAGRHYKGADPIPLARATHPQAQPLTDELIPKPEWADTESDWVVKFKRVEGGAT